MGGSWTGVTGVVIAGRYRLGMPIAKGAMGEVWRAEHLALRAPVAVKLIDPELVRTLAGSEEEHELLARFEREARAGALLRHPNVVHVYDHGVDEGVPYMVMELLDGETLASRLARGVLQHGETARTLHGVARALARAHELGIVHRDLKPENVFLVRDDDEASVKVLDFGVAKLQEGSEVMGTHEVRGLTSTQSGHLLGTPCYMSPEQIEGRLVDWRADLWALAVIAYECVCGKRPFDAHGMGALSLKICVEPLPVPSRHASVPPGFDAWWARAATRDRAGRFQTARELSDALRSVLAPAYVPEPSNPTGFVSRPVGGIGVDIGTDSALEVQVRPRTLGAYVRPRSAGRTMAIASGLIAVAVATIAGVSRLRGSGGTAAAAPYDRHEDTGPKTIAPARGDDARTPDDPTSSGVALPAASVPGVSSASAPVPTVARPATARATPPKPPRGSVPGGASASHPAAMPEPASTNDRLGF